MHPVTAVQSAAAFSSSRATRHIELTAGHVARLDDLPRASGEPYDADNKAAIDR